jgi:ribose transport system permease protein
MTSSAHITSAPARSGGSAAGIVRTIWNATGQSPAWPLLVLLIVFFAIGSPRFPTWFNTWSVLSQTTLVGVLAVGLTPLVISGNVDLSVGALAGFATCLIVYLQAVAGLVPAVVLTLAAATGIGLLNGIIVERLGLNSIIVTLATMNGVRGLGFLLFGERTVSAPDTTLVDIGSIKFGRIGFDVIIFFGFAAAVAWMLRATVHGVHTYSIGGNRRAALDAGVRVTAHVLGNFALSGAAAGLCGVMLVAALGSGAATYGRDYELWAIIAVVLGGTRLAGGRGFVLGTVAAALSLAVLRNGVNLMRIEVRYVLIILGAVLVAALALDRLRSGEPEVSE